jgi:hypothetical protein
MEYLFIALAVFTIVRIVQVWVDAPAWFWSLAQLVGCVLATIPWSQEWMRWYSPFAIAGIITFLQMLENLLIAKSDEALSAIMRRR